MRRLTKVFIAALLAVGALAATPASANAGVVPGSGTVVVDAWDWGGGH